VEWIAGFWESDGDYYPVTHSAWVARPS